MKYSVVEGHRWLNGSYILRRWSIYENRGTDAEHILAGNLTESEAKTCAFAMNAIAQRADLWSGVYDAQTGVFNKLLVYSGPTEGIIA